MLYQQCKHKERTILTKKAVKNYFLAFDTLFFRWAISCGKPVIAPFWHQVVFQFLIEQCMVALEIHVQGISKALAKTRALLSKPEGMFKTDDHSWTCNSEKQKLWGVSVTRPIRAGKDGVYGIGNNKWNELRRMRGPYIELSTDNICKIVYLWNEGLLTKWKQQFK